ncbi:MAG: Crp/Fnr family transcriptional regulator [Pseudotabrizicola sp.]|nr:Crp/Fnr family transcriptional regulator [Pseudotabrizicola sp.]
MIPIMSVELFPLFDGGRTRSLGKDKTLFHTGEPVRSMFLVLQGEVDLIRHTPSGLRVLLFRASTGSVLAEASAYSDVYHCDGVAVGPAQVRFVSVASFRTRLDASAGLASAWAARLAHGLQGARMNAAIRTMRTVDERLDAWLAGGKALPPKGQWQTLADALGVTREALYRELSKRRPVG